MSVYPQYFGTALQGLSKLTGLVCLFSVVGVFAPGNAQAFQLFDTLKDSVMCEPGCGSVPQQDWPIIEEIRFHGNRKTIPRTMLQEMVVKVGSPADPDQIEYSRQAIMDLGLFKSVNIKTTKQGDGVVLDVNVSEKYFLLVLPTFARSADGDLSYGASVDWNNVAGRNQTLKSGFKYKTYSSAEIDTEKNLGLDYTIPRIKGGPWQLDVFSNISDESITSPVDDESTYRRNSSTLGFKVGRWFVQSGPSRGWFMHTGLVSRHREHDLLSGTPGLYQDGTRHSYLLELGYAAIHDHLYSRTGKEFGWEMEWGRSTLNNENDFNTNLFYYRGYNWLGGKPHHNLNYQFRLGLASDTFFDEPNYKLGGSETLRGYERESVNGNAFLLANVEYLRPLFGKDSLRGVVFMDTGGAWPDINDINTSDWKLDGGVGLRWRIKSFVNLTLRLDLGISADGENKIYAGTKIPF